MIPNGVEVGVKPLGRVGEQGCRSDHTKGSDNDKKLLGCVDFEAPDWSTVVNDAKLVATLTPVALAQSLKLDKLPPSCDIVESTNSRVLIGAGSFQRRSKRCFLGDDRRDLLCRE